jgi:hypothetical protein
MYTGLILNGGQGLSEGGSDSEVWGRVWCAGRDGRQWKEVEGENTNKHALSFGHAKVHLWISIVLLLSETKKWWLEC